MIFLRFLPRRVLLGIVVFFLLGTPTIASAQSVGAVTALLGTSLANLQTTLVTTANLQNQLIADQNALYGTAAILLNESSSTPTALAMISAAGSIGVVITQLQVLIAGAQTLINDATALSGQVGALSGSYNTSVLSALSDMAGTIAGFSVSTLANTTGTITAAVGGVNSQVAALLGADPYAANSSAGVSGALPAVTAGITTSAANMVEMGGNVDLSSIVATDAVATGDLSVPSTATSSSSSSSSSSSGSICGGNSGGSSAGPGGTPFGGLSTYIKYCTCTGNIALTIKDLTVAPPLVLPIIYEPGVTNLCQFGQVYRTGVYTLGLWNPGGVCKYYVGFTCVVWPTQGTMKLVGTSM